MAMKFGRVGDVTECVQLLFPFLEENFCEMHAWNSKRGPRCSKCQKPLLAARETGVTLLKYCAIRVRALSPPPLLTATKEDQFSSDVFPVQVFLCNNVHPLLARSFCVCARACERASQRERACGGGGACVRTCTLLCARVYMRGLMCVRVCTCTCVCVHVRVWALVYVRVCVSVS
jgi:hypothetical protein